jgi:tetratricopeptide (TPR) repeat protein
MAEASWPDDDSRVLRSQFELARLWRLMGEFDAARALIESVRARCPEAPTADVPDLLEVIAEVGLLDMAEGRPAEGQSQLRAALDDSLKSPPGSPAHPNTLALQHILGNSLLAQRDLAGAEEFLTQAWDRADGVLTETQLCSLAHTFARLRDAQGREAGKACDAAAVTRLDAEAEGLFWRALRGSRRVNGERHPETVTVLNNYAIFLRHRGLLTEARPVLEEAQDVLRDRADGGGADLLMVWNSLGALEHAAGNHAEAERLWRDVLIAEAAAAQAGVVAGVGAGAGSGGASPARSGRYAVAGKGALRNLVILLANAGRYAEALPLAEVLLQRSSPGTSEHDDFQRILTRVQGAAEEPDEETR